MAGLVRRNLIYEANTKLLHSEILDSDSFLWRLDGGAEGICKRAINNWKPLRRVKGALGHARRKDRETLNLWPSSEWRKFFDFIAWRLHEKTFIFAKKSLWLWEFSFRVVTAPFLLFSTVKPQLACHWSVGKHFPSNRMLRTRGIRESLSRNGSHFVARFVRLRCYFWHYFRLFLGLSCKSYVKLCNF